MACAETGRAGQTRKRLMEAAETEFSEKGLAGARVDEIARSAGVNKRMLYAYFGSKEGLYMAVLETVYNRLHQCEAAAGLEKLPVETAIGALVENYFRFLQDNDSYVRMVMWENLNRGRYMDERGLTGVRDPMRRAMAELIRRGKTTGSFRADADEEQVLLSLFALTFNYFSNYHTLTRVMHRDLLDEEEVHKRVSAITAMLLADLKEVEP